MKVSPEEMNAVLMKARKENVWINKQVRKAMDKMDEASGRPTKVERLQAALIRIKDSGQQYTTGDGHARCVKIATEALAQEEAS